MRKNKSFKGLGHFNEQNNSTWGNYQKYQYMYHIEKKYNSRAKMESLFFSLKIKNIRLVGWYVDILLGAY